MPPYLTAYHKYHERPPAIGWTHALDFHLQHGMILSTPDCFVMLRPIPDDAADADIIALKNWPIPSPTTWHIWMAAGNLTALLGLAKFHRIEHLTFQRRDERVRKCHVAALRPRASHNIV
jgi:hypothetical protein